VQVYLASSSISSKQTRQNMGSIAAKWHLRTLELPGSLALLLLRSPLRHTAPLMSSFHGSTTV
jgi:hypothetical protein